MTNPTPHPNLKHWGEADDLLAKSSLTHEELERLVRFMHRHLVKLDFESEYQYELGTVCCERND